MKIVNSREFRDHQKKYFDLVDNKEQVIVRRSKNRAYKIVPVSEDDVIVNANEISPGGDEFWADKRNVEAVLDRLKKVKDSESIDLKTKEDIETFLDNL